MSPQGTTSTTFDNALKYHYASGPLLNLAAQKNVTLGLMGKKNRRPTDGGGRSWIQPIRISYPGGGSTDFATALAATNNATGYGSFTVTRKAHYRLAKVENQLVEATETGDEDSFDRALDELDRALEAEANYLNFRLFRNSGGAAGKVSNSTFTGAITTLTDASDCWAWVKGDVANSASTDGTSGAIRAGSLTVASVQRSAGTITWTANQSTGIPAIAQNDFLFLAGDFGGAISGFSDWVPDAAPSATAFYGQDRSIEPEMLGGLRVDGSTSGAPIHEILIDMMAQGEAFGASFDVVIMHPLATANLTKQLEGKWVIMKGQGYDGEEIDVGYKGWNVHLGGQDVTIMTDRVCPAKKTYGLQLDTWTLFSAGSAPGFLQKRGGSIMKPSENSDAWEARVGEYINASCAGPGWNVVGLLP